MKKLISLMVVAMMVISMTGIVCAATDVNGAKTYIAGIAGSNTVSYDVVNILKVNDGVKDLSILSGSNVTFSSTVAGMDKWYTNIYSRIIADANSSAITGDVKDTILNSKVSGSFDVTIDATAFEGGFSAPTVADFTTLDTTIFEMAGVSATNGVYVCTVKVKDDVKVSDLSADKLSEVTFSKSVNVPSKSGSYTMKVSFDGTIKFVSGTDELATMNFSSQEAKRTVSAFSPSGTGSGSSSATRPGTVVKPDPTPVTPSTPSDKQFDDVQPVSHWAKEAIEYVVKEGLMKGVSEKEFAPDLSLTRGMLVTVLYRLAKEPEAKDLVSFKDVADGTYYEKAVKWAQENGIVNGISEDEFAPDMNITREQIATILYRFAKFMGYDVTQGGMKIREFSDYDDISDYALEALTWAVNVGLINGRENNNVAPQDFATRAEIATILYRFVETYNK